MPEVRIEKYADDAEIRGMVTFTHAPKGKPPVDYEVPVFDPDVLKRCDLSPAQVKEVLAYLIAGDDPFRGWYELNKRHKVQPNETRIRWMLKILNNFMKAQGERFLSPLPTYFDESTLKLHTVGERAAWSLLYPFGFVSSSANYTTLTSNLFEQAVNRWPTKPVHNMAYMADDFTVYLRASETTMLKITVDDIVSVPLGTDGVLLRADGWADFPRLDELAPVMDELRPKIGKNIVNLIPGTPLTDLYTTRFSFESALSPEQAQTMAIERLLFIAAASQHPNLWPITVITGVKDSGKSTLAEIRRVMFEGRDDVQLDALNTKMSELVAQVTNNSTGLDYDNSDESYNPKKTPEIGDFICQLATGAKVSLRILYRNNEKSEYEIRKHVTFSTRENIFAHRDDIARRILHFECRPPDDDKLTKRRLLKNILKHRTDLLADFIVRVQNLVRAHQGHAEDDFNYVSGMAEYEEYSYTVASYEDRLAEAKERWLCYMTGYKEAIASDNSLVYGSSLWLAQDPERANKPFTASQLYYDLQDLYRAIDQEFNYRDPGSFGRALKKQAPALTAALGFRQWRDQENRWNQFEPTPEALQACDEKFQIIVPRLRQWNSTLTGCVRSQSLGPRHRPTPPPVDWSAEDVDDMQPAAVMR